MVVAFTQPVPSPAPSPPSPAGLPWEVYRQNVPRVWRILSGRHVVEHDRADACHEVFLRAQEKLCAGTQPRNMHAWLAEIARNVAAEYVGRWKRDEARFVPEDAAWTVAAPTDPHARQCALVRSLLDELPDEAPKDVLIRFYIEEQSVEDMVDELQRPEGTIRRQLQAGLKAFQDVYARHEEQERWKARSRRTAAVVPILGAVSLLHALRDMPVPDGLQEAVWARLSGHAGGGGGGPAAPAMPPHAPMAPLAPAAAMSWNGRRASLALVAALALVAFGALWDPLHRTHRTPTEARPDAVGAVVTASAAPSVAPVPSLIPAPSATGTSSTALRAAPNGEPEEVLIERLRRALAEGDIPEALATCEKHARLYPHGSLASMRDASWIDALMRAGRRAEARQRFKTYAATHPNDALTHRLRAQMDAAP